MPAPPPFHATVQLDRLALAFAAAAHFDSLLRTTTDDATEDALLACGDVLGGLSCNGFVADLRAHLDGIEARALADATRHDYQPGMGGNDPDCFVSGRLEDAIADAQAAALREWHQAAERVTARLLEAA